ncbi:13805_t:CDS:2 [Entrophospora sp. SA101]|nr:13805_t:CDS:2 [Entrophospora sp. SA101]
MPQKSSKSAAAKNRNNKQNQNSDTGQFTFTTKSDDEYLPSCEYSEDSSDDDFVAEKFQQLSESKKLIWTKEADVKGKKPYTGKSRATYYKKYGPSGKYTKAASFSQSITHFFPIESKGINELDEENTMSELNSSEGENDSGHESESNESSEQESDFEVENDNSLEPKLTELENILSSNLKKITAYDYLKYKSLQLFFKGCVNENLTKIEASLQSAKAVYDKGPYKAQQVRYWAKCWIKDGCLPKSLQGCHQKINRS